MSKPREYSGIPNMVYALVNIEPGYRYPDVVSADLNYLNEIKRQHDELIEYVPKDKYDSLLAQADKLAEALDDLIESIETPSRLGVSDPPNPDWVALNNAKKEIKDYRGEK